MKCSDIKLIFHHGSAVHGSALRRKDCSHLRWWRHDSWGLSIFWHQPPSISVVTNTKLMGWRRRRRLLLLLLHNLVWVYKKARGAQSLTSSAQVRPADRDARDGAHVPRAAVLPAVVRVGAEGRLQVHRGECRHAHTHTHLRRWLVLKLLFLCRTTRSPKMSYILSSTRSWREKQRRS